MIPWDGGWISSGIWEQEEFEGFSPKSCLGHDQNEVAQEGQQHRAGDCPPALHFGRTHIPPSREHVPPSLPAPLTIFSDIPSQP